MSDGFLLARKGGGACEGSAVVRIYCLLCISRKQLSIEKLCEWAMWRHGLGINLGVATDTVEGFGVDGLIR